ncbi:MAG: HD-GYP domain-containing protein [Thiothrix sp.]|uniref:HD-GYP domain-containing protein n=1 Tax=Thiothrix sp. TaxID=1032 RepID=UPI002607800F|nr:HD-GYP domain-containing protein [Thiothrix sp.]MDD5393316.1 HD-GYP domain-containing protein [Thiothrix sp.]
MTKLLSAIYDSLNIVVFVREPNGCFTLHNPAPEWLVFFLGKSSYPQTCDLPELFPYLTCFMDDAEQHWHEHLATPLASGSWIETDELGNELALEATAVWVDDHAVLLLQNLGEKYRQEVSRLQQVRNGLLTQEKLENEVQKRTIKIKQREEEIAIKLVSVTSYRDEETGAHVRRIGLYAAAMAKALNWPTQQIDDIRIAAPMHDLGKIGIPDKILLKKGKLTNVEFSIMKRHTEIGAKMLQDANIPALDMAAEIALCHHEKWDGSGYPRELKGENIPITARITSIVDIYDALVHERVYKKAMCEKDAIALMSSMAGSHLDPELFAVFLELLPVMRRIRTEVHEIKDLIVSY